MRGSAIPQASVLVLLFDHTVRDLPISGLSVIHVGKIINRAKRTLLRCFLSLTERFVSYDCCPSLCSLSTFERVIHVGERRQDGYHSRIDGQLPPQKHYSAFRDVLCYPQSDVYRPVHPFMPIAINISRASASARISHPGLLIRIVRTLDLCSLAATRPRSHRHRACLVCCLLSRYLALHPGTV